MWIDKKFIGHSEEYFDADSHHYRAGRFCTTKIILVERWKDNSNVRETVRLEELPEGIQNQIKATFA
ncbi:hypothetical protein H6784_00760 [Candidatus Nomurabacteria bacterium]|nr:hypothetical protein [Candidatus Nomurabacteria bacterium]